MAKDILAIASALDSLYNKINGFEKTDSDLSEMKMHKLLYFAQKYHYYHFGKWLFNEDFEGWIHGPVSKTYRNNKDDLSCDESISLEEEYTLRDVIFELGDYGAYELRDLSHEENAFRISRKELCSNERGYKIIKKEHIISDMNEDDDALIEYSEV
ncbi:Panacea domain-containing protein [Salicibibacter kimchii]|uniref:DUF4065 domain-containing protein n=1 Tax=Salicibibacter kimchii TaxID=2099786 RepID=A0A345BUK9_9BACI|nr:type II toxin-antitoxin system antitoxin SocA domain-containing protein [Salicibibacter kimchii]AXF54640.1 DUF4065 domain-containing protein [Salicibibacter kimchii]